jgi:hypothetical protein
MTCIKKVEEKKRGREKENMAYRFYGLDACKGEERLMQGESDGAMKKGRGEERYCMQVYT